MSRMDKYYKADNNQSKRSLKNQDLYKNIYDTGEYSNIEGIATIDKSNEVDITKVKNMLRNREDFQKQRDINLISPRKQVSKTFETFENEEDRIYDIRDVLNKAKISKPTEEKYKTLSNTNFDILKELKSRNKPVEEDNLMGLIDSISSTSKLNKLSDQELGLDMFDTLKSVNNTFVGGKDSVKALLDEAKKVEARNLASTSTNLDKSFFTSSLNFNEEDFEQIVELNRAIKKNNVLIKILFLTVLISLASGIIFLVFNLIK